MQAAPTCVDKAEPVSANGTLHTAMTTGTSSGNAMPWVEDGGALGAEAAYEPRIAYMDAQNARNGQDKETVKYNSEKKGRTKNEKAMPSITGE